MYFRPLCLKIHIVYTLGSLEKCSPKTTSDPKRLITVPREASITDTVSEFFGDSAQQHSDNERLLRRNSPLAS